MIIKSYYKTYTCTKDTVFKNIQNLTEYTNMHTYAVHMYGHLRSMMTQITILLSYNKYGKFPNSIIHLTLSMITVYTKSE